MATATTAVAALKFADTLDITLLTPEQIAKFTEKDFAAFSTQQQVDLTASQVGLLTAKQIAALPFKLLEPNTITGIQPKVLSALDLKTLSADQFAALLPAQVQALTPLQITNLTTAQVDALAPEQTAVLTSAQVTAFTDKSLKVLSEFALEALSVDAIKGLTPANIIGLTTDSIKILTVDQVAALKADQVKALTPALVAAMEAEDLAALTPDAVKGFNAKAIPSLEINALTPEQLAVLTPKQMSSFTATQLGLLDETYAPVFNARVLALLSTAQVNAMSTAVVNALDPLAVKGFTVKNIKGLSTDQLAVITPEQGVNLSKSQLGSLDATKVSSLPSEVIVELKPQVLKSLPVNIIANLSAGAFAAFTDVQIAGLGSKQIAGLTTSQAASLTSEHIQKFTPTAFKNLSDSSISALSASALAGLTSKQITGLTTAQLEKMTPAQVAQFAQELKDWAVTTKRYATVESAETAIATAQGIKTGGTVTGTARAETVTSGAGNDTITYTGTATAGDKITTGTGNDSINVLAPTSGAHTIDAGTGTDTLTFNDATPTLTSVTGVEVVVLANTGAQSFNAGSGTDNALTSLTATAITAGNTLALTGSVANLPVSINAGILDANAYGAKLIVTAGAAANTIKTGTGNDSIVGGGGSDSIESGSGNDTVTTTSANDTIKGEGGDDSISAGDGDNSILGAAGNDTITTGTGADTINGGTDVDSMTGGTSADKFIFAAGDNSVAPSDSVFDTITDFGIGSDVVDFDATVTIATNSTTATTTVAKISQAGKAFFDSTTTSLADKITAVKGGIAAVNSQIDGEAAVFTHGSDGYIFIAAGASASANDVLIKLEGEASVTNGLVIDTDGNISSVTGEAADAASYTGTGLHVIDDAATIKAALENSGSTLIAAITAGKISNITASDGASIVLTPTAFAQVLGTSSTKVADLLDTGSVQLNSTLGSATISFLTSNASKIAAQGITTTGLTLDKDQFSTLASKLGTTVTLDATGATAAELATIDSSISSISSITNLSLPTVDGTTITQTIATSLLSKATNANVVATGHSASSLYDNYTHIATGSSTAGISGTIPTLTATQFKLLGAKIQDGVTAPSVTVSATEAVDSTILSAISADAANIASTGISSASGALTLGLTAEQFAGLSAKLGTNVTANVDATNATTSQLAAVSTNIGGGSTKVASITNLTATLANLDDTQTPNLLSKATSASVVATDASSTEIAALVTNKAHIASTGITGTIPLTVTQYADLYPKLHVANANVTVTLDVSDQGQTRLDTMLDNISAVDTLGGTLTVTAAQFVKTGFATKLNSSGIAVTINASSATNAQLKTISDTITSTPNIVSSISGLTLDLSVDYATAGAGSGASAANDTVTANLLSKATGATVYANNSETASELASLTTYAANISTVSNANNTVLAADFAANYTNLPQGVVVDAANASADNLRVVITQINANSAKVGSIKNLTINNQEHTASDVALLLGKAQAGAVSVTGTWADSSTIANFVTNVHKLKDGGLGGVGMAMTATQFSTLGAKISSSVTDMTVDATTTPTTNGTASQLATISNYAARVALVNNLTIDLGNSLITNAVTANLMARAALTSVNVVATGATAAELNSVAANIGNVVNTTGITGVIAIDSNVSASNITALFGKTATTTGTVNVSGMSASQISAVSGVSTSLAALGVTGSVSNMDSTQLNSLAGITAAKIGDLTGVLALNSDVTAANITALHLKYVGTDATVSITGMDSTQIGNLVNADIATGGITGSVTGLNAAALTALALKATDIASNTLTGVLALDSGVSTASDITTLFDRYAGTTATVDATSMTATQLIEVAGGVSKIQASGITNLSSATSFTLGTANVTGTVVNALLSKSAGNVTLDITGTASDDLDSLISNVGKIATGGASTGLTTSNTNDVFTDTQFTALQGKLATGETVYVNAEGATTAELSAIATNISKVTATGLTNLTVTNTQSASDITALLTKAPVSSATAGAKVSATSMTSAQLGAVGAASEIANVMAAGITGAMHIAADVDGATNNGTMIGALFTKYSGTTATADVTGMVAAEITALVNDKISTGGITGSLNGLATADTTALVAKISDVADGTSSAGLTTGASGFTVLNSNFSTLAPKLQTTYDPSKITVDFNSVTGGVTLTATQNGAGAAGVAFTGAGANTQTVTISTASTALTTNAVIEAYVLAGTGANTITLSADGQSVTTAVHASNQTVNTGIADFTSGTITGNSTATDILNVTVNAAAAGISTLTTTTVDQITLASGISTKMTIAQNAKVTTATGTNTVTLSAAGTATGAAQVESYVLATGANTFTLGYAGQGVTFQTGNSDTLNVGGLTVTGTFAGIEAADTIVMTTGANIASMAGTNAVAAFADITGSVTMTAAQATAFEAGTITANGTSDQITLTDAASALALDATIETYVLANASNSVTLGIGTQNVTGNANVDALTIPTSMNVSGTIALAAGANTVGIDTGATISGTITAAGGTAAVTLVSGASVTMTAAAHALFAATGIAGAGTEQITISDVFTGTGDADIETYVLNAASTFTLGAVGQNVTGAASTADTISVEALTVTGAINGGTGTANTLLVKDGAVLTTATVSNFANLTFDATGVISTNDLTLTPTQHALFTGTITAAGTGANHEKITLTTDFSGTALAGVEEYVLAGATNTLTLVSGMTNVTAGGSAVDTIIVNAGYTSGLTIASLATNDVVNLAAINANLNGAAVNTTTPGDNAWGISGGALYFDADPTAGTNYIFITGVTTGSMTNGVLTIV